MTSLMHISEQAWSDYTAADYSVEQWHQACLIHQHQGAPTSKGQCKLPVRTPQGAVNRNGVHAAAAALAGARGGVQASPDEMSSAKAALRRLYSQLGEDVPDSLKHSTLEDFLEHYGVKGMKWGQRKAVVREGPAEDAVRVVNIHSRVSSHKSTRILSNKELKEAIDRMNLEQQYTRLSGGNDKTRLQKGRIIVREFLQNALKTNVQQAFNSQVKDKMDQKLQQGRYEPSAVAEREAKARRLKEQSA